MGPRESARLSANRQERLRTFQRSLEHHGVASTFELLPAAEHDSGHQPAAQPPRSISRAV
jgi:hypothetical protein